MNKIKTYITFILITLISFPCYPNSVITFFLQPYPKIKESLNEKQISKYSKKLQQPGYLLKKIVKSTRIQNGVQGVMCMYLGYVNTSDNTGKVTFPRKQQYGSMNILITKGIKPIYMIAPETVHNWMLDTSQPAKMYQFNVHHDEPSELFYINAKTVDLPKNNMITLDTVIIIADPKNVFIPNGATIIHYSPNLILPNIYIKKHFNFSYNALYTLSIKQYFEQINHEYKQEDQTVSTILQR